MRGLCTGVDQPSHGILNLPQASPAHRCPHLPRGQTTNPQGPGQYLLHSKQKGRSKLEHTARASVVFNGRSCCADGAPPLAFLPRMRGLISCFIPASPPIPSRFFWSENFQDLAAPSRALCYFFGKDSQLAGAFLAP